MTSDRWKQIKTLFQAVLERPEAERAAFLAGAASGDDSLRREVESLLDSDANAGRHDALEPWSLAAASLLPLPAGHRIGSYEVIEAIGTGAMGEVYRARDTRLGREVALKVLPFLFARDPDRLARFRREAQLLAALNHPNIGAIYGLEEADGEAALVLELVEGSTLADRISRGPLAVPEALAIARQIADGLAAAHAKGIIHRDLKPANLTVTPAGVVKVLDFGLARSADPETAPPLRSDRSARVVAPGETRDGLIVGTMSYMSPEQARGLPVDARTDIWAFGCVLVEMLTGRKAFDPRTAAAGVSAGLEREAPLALLPSDTPDGVRELIGRCLQEDPTRRLRRISDARLHIDRALGRHARRRSRRVLTGIGIVAAVALSAVVYPIVQRGTFSRSNQSAWVQLTNVDSAVQPALSPDGRMLAFIRGSNPFTTTGQLYVKELPDGDPLPLTDDSSTKMGPAFSPDGGRLAYTVQDGGRWDTWMVPVRGGAPRLWQPNASGLTWIGPDRLLYSEIKSGIHMAIVTADAGRTTSHDVYVPRPVSAMAHRSHASPDGKRVLVVEMDAAGVWRQCRVVPIDGASAGRTIGPPGARCTGAAWSPDGRSIYVTANAGSGFHIWRQRFPDGPPEQITSGPTEEEGVAIAADGRSLITSVGLVQRSVWVHDSSGERQISLEGYAYWPLLSADGTKVCFRVARTVTTGQAASELWVSELRSGQTRRLFDGRLVTGYDLSRDDRVVASITEPDGRTQLWAVWLDGRRPPQPIPGAVGDNPRFGARGEIYFRAVDGETQSLSRVREDGSAREKVADISTSIFGRVSPDGEWLSNYTREGMVARSTGGAAAVPIFRGVSRLRWSADGAHVYLSIQHGDATAFGSGRTYMIPLSEDRTLPPVPPGGFESEEAMAALPGLRIFPHGDLAPGPSPDVYAFSKTTTTRNLYRIPLP